MKDSRLLFTLLLGVVVVGLFVHFHPLTPQDETLRVEKLHDDLYVLYGGGGNTAFYVMKNSVLVVDAKINTAWSQQIIEQIRKVTLKPVRYLVNTHYHGDHTRGNPSFAKGIEILSHNLTRKNLLEYNGDDWSDKVEFIPNVTFTKDLTLYDGDDQVELVYVGAAHTDGDAIVIFPKYKTAHLGDLLFQHAIPFIDEKAGGSSQGYVDVLNKVLRMDIETFIPGHGQVTDRAGVQEFVRYHEDLQTAVRKAVREGLSLEEAKERVKLPKYAQYNRYEKGLASNIEVVYHSLTAGH